MHFSLGFPGRTPLISPGFPKLFPLKMVFSDGFPMVFLWFSHGITRTLPGLSKVSTAFTTAIESYDSLSGVTVTRMEDLGFRDKKTWSIKTWTVIRGLLLMVDGLVITNGEC